MALNPGQRRPALGQVWELGSLYDARRDAFVPLSLLKGIPPPSSVIVTDNYSSDVKVSFTDTYDEKFKQMNLDPELSASFLSGLIQVDGSGGYLSDSRDSNQMVHASLHYKASTVHEKLNLMDPSLRNCLDLDILKDGCATHVVAEIGWGALTVVAAKHAPTGQQSQSEIEDIFKARFAILESIARDGIARYSSSSKADPEASINVYSDVGSKEKWIPSSFQDVFQFISSVPEYIFETNGGKGQPTIYVLLPLGFLSYFFAIGSCPTTTPLSTDCLGQFVQLFDGLRDSRQKLNDYMCALQSYSFVSPNHMDAVNGLYGSAVMAEHDLKSRYSSLLVSVRNGTSDMQQMWSLLQEFRDGPSSPQKLLSLTIEYEEKMRTIDMITSKGGRYVAFNSRRSWYKFGPKDTYVLFYFNDLARSDPKLWKGNLKLMLDLLDNRRGNCEILLCDCDSDSPTPRQLKISLYRKQKVLVNDLLDDEKFLSDKSLAQCDSGYFERDGAPKPQHRRAVKIPCPGSNCADNGPVEWFCTKCKAPIEFGDADKQLYCDCGHGTYLGYSFKCKDMINHGSSFERFKGRDLQQLLQGLEPYKDLNILILGETGVGKSTFINAFVNYLTFETLDEAIQHESLQSIIPCSFSTQYLDDEGGFHQEEIKVGHSADENDGSGGASATQSTTVYRIQMGDMTVRLIDTPGIGDTRGIEQDKRNMADILTKLAGFENLHGILILLKPNSARLTLMFKFCVTELLTHLHRDAAANMVFGFTSTRMTNYMPGDAFKPLQTLLKKYDAVRISLTHKNTYCFDSESFRFLAALKQTGRAMENEDDFRRSWKRSEEESHRLLDHFQTLQPHLVKGTLSLNRARDLITKLTKPIAEIMDVINTTIRINEDHIKELADERCKGDALKARLNFQKATKSSKPLDKPRTVCTEWACTDRMTDAVGATKKIYKTHCHKVCYLTEVPREVAGTEALKHCAAFSGGRCNLCKHGWKSHQHVWYELENKLTTEKDPTVEKSLKDHESEIKVKEAAIKVLARKLTESREELKELEDAAAQFGLFLKMNSITAYNDEMIAYLDEQIKEAKQTLNETRTSKDRLEGLERTRKEYQQHIRILEKEMRAGQTRKPLDERDIELLVRKLYNLKNWGKNLKDIKTAAENYGSSTYQERLFRAPRHWHTEHSGHTHRRTPSVARGFQGTIAYRPAAVRGGENSYKQSYSQPSSSYSQPSSSYSQPSSSYSQPGSSYSQPDSSSSPPGTSYSQPSTAYSQPSTAYSQSSGYSQSNGEAHDSPPAYTAVTQQAYSSLIPSGDEYEVPNMTVYNPRSSVVPRSLASDHNMREVEPPSISRKLKSKFFNKFK